MLRLFMLAGGILATSGIAFSQFSTSDIFSTLRRPVTQPVVIQPTTPAASSSTTASITPTVTVTLDYARPYTSLNSGPAVVKKETFGSVYTTFLTLSNFDRAISQAPNYSLRWPGGTFAETNTQLYSLNYPDVYFEPEVGENGYNPETQKGLRNVMAYAVERKQPFVMVIPTRPYFNNVAQGQQDLQNFLIKLLRGDFGEIPKSMTLEIGNETMATGWVNGKFTPGPGSYGFVANAFLTTINTVLASSSLNPSKRSIDVATWLGTTEGGQNSIFSQISPANLKTVDQFVHHYGLVDNSKEYDFATINRRITAAKKYWNTAWGRSVPEFKIIATEWNVGGASEPSSQTDVTNIDIGRRQAGTIIQTFSQMIGGGLDTAMVWGVQNKISSIFWHNGETISHGGQAFRLLSESLVGSQLLAGKVDRNGNWTKTALTHDVIAYKTATSTIIFLMASDIPATGLHVQFSISNFGTIKSIATESITTASSNNGESSIESDRLGDEPVITTGTLTPINGKFTYTLTEDYQVVRIIVNK